jgi:hypothetical protein
MVVLVILGGLGVGIGVIIDSWPVEAVGVACCITALALMFGDAFRIRRRSNSR